MAYQLPGLGGHNGVPNGQMEADAGLFVQQLLDQVHQNGTTPVPPLAATPVQQMVVTPVQQQVQPQAVAGATPVKQEQDTAMQTPPEAIMQPPTIPHQNGSATPAEGGSIDVPQCLIFGGETGEDEFLIPGRCLQKLPQEVLANLLKDGERMGAFHRLGSIPHWESMMRLNHWLDHGDYKPFKPVVPVEYLDANGTAHVWNNRDSPNTVEITRATFELFTREIDLYVFAAKLGYTELRRTSAERLCIRYPKSAESIMTLVEKAGPTAVQCQDSGLIQKIITYINTNCRELTAMPSFLTQLRKVTRGRPPFGSALLEAYFSASEALRREGVPPKVPGRMSIASTGSAGGISAPMTPTSGVNSVTPSVAPAQPAPLAAPRPHPNPLPFFNSPMSAFEIPNLVEALNKSCLVIANDNGYGTLVRDGARKQRNTEFKFQKGELLVADRDAHTANGRHNMLVMNSRGETGDILRTLVKKVPPGLGVLAAEHAVNDGKTPSTPRPADREERTYNPFPPPPQRGRSRSPPRHHPRPQWGGPR